MANNTRTTTNVRKLKKYVDNITPVSATSTNTLTNKTLTTPVITTIYQDAGKTKLMTLPDSASDTLTANAATQTLTNKTLTAPVITSPDITNGQASHDYEGAAVAWTLSAAELKASTLIVTNANGAADIIAPTTAGKRYTVVNNSGQAITIKKTGGTGIVVANTKVAMVEYVGSDYIRLTADV